MSGPVGETVGPGAASVAAVDHVATSPARTGAAAARRLAGVRRGLLVVTATVVVGIGLELASSRHWQSPKQAVAWVALGGAALAWALVASRRAGRARHLLLGVVGAGALLGVWFHLLSNHDAGPLDRDYATTWHMLPAWRQWWLAASGGVGPSPPLVPLTLLLVVVLLVLAAACGPAPSRRAGAQAGTSS